MLSMNMGRNPRRFEKIRLLPFQVQFVFHPLFLFESQNFRRHIALPSLIRAFLMLSMSRRSVFPGNIFEPMYYTFHNRF